MKSVLISIQPKWCELIASGKKTVEVRKTKPKLETPFKCYIYETKGKLKWCNKCQDTDCVRPYPNCACHEGWGKVIGEFVCDYMNYYTSNCTVFESVLLPSPTDLEEMCLTLEELNAYGTRGKLLYGWHISDLVIYEKPRELSEFRSYNVNTYIDENGYPMPTHEIKRPFQSWGYVESEDER